MFYMLWINNLFDSYLTGRAILTWQKFKSDESFSIWVTVHHNIYLQFSVCVMHCSSLWIYFSWILISTKMMCYLSKNNKLVINNKFMRVSKMHWQVKDIHPMVNYKNTWKPLTDHHKHVIKVGWPCLKIRNKSEMLADLVARPRVSLKLWIQNDTEVSGLGNVFGNIILEPVFKM